MFKSKKSRFLKYAGHYLTSVIPFSKSPHIEEAKNYYPFAVLVRLFVLLYYGVSFRVVEGLSISGHFDAKMEVETGGVRGYVAKNILKLIRWLEEKKREIE